MSSDDDDNIGLKIPTQKLIETTHNPKNTTSSLTKIPKEVSKQIEVVTIKTIVVNVYLNIDKELLHTFLDELEAPCKYIPIGNNGKNISILHQYVLNSTSKAIDMSNQSVRTVYRPNLFIRKNDAFGPWNYNYLLTLLELDYQRDESNEQEFPPVWKTGSNTHVRVNRIKKYAATSNINSNKKSSTTSDAQEDITLKCLLKTICRQNKCDEKDAKKWLAALEEENISTVEHLRDAAMNDASWEKITSVKHLVKKMIRDYVQLSAASNTFNATNNIYDKSKATLIGDIHRVRRYFHSVTHTLENIPHLDRDAVDEAIREIRLTYDDDGNVLNNIHAYLKTFCLQNTKADPAILKQQREGWITERDQLNRAIVGLKMKAADKKRTINLEDSNVQIWRNKLKQENQNSRKRRQKEIRAAQEGLAKAETQSAAAKEPLVQLEKEIAQKEEKVRNLEALINVNVDEAMQKLNVKYGRGLLLYGPPGTGKSELLKRAAIFAGITMTTTPLAAGELNRPYVGETERLLVDIMYRADSIPFLICAMTIDEIDGLVPKRDNNAQQSKVDGISVLLSHIEGVKNIPNLIVFGATNRRNMMDEAFLRRMQGKCFVGRPSPNIRKKMLEPLLCKDPQMFNVRYIDFLVKLTTNFSGAAVGALKSSIIVSMDQNHQSTTLSDRVLLDLADAAAREFSCWFGTGTLPEICRLNPSILSSDDQKQKYSLILPQCSPSGRILIDLEDRKCLIELVNEATREENLDENETSTQNLLSRFINGCYSRNIDTIQVIDLNFLVKHNAFDENQVFELLTTTFLECNEYNRSMLIFDIDSLIMLSISDSNMSKSISISNMHLYQFIREECKKAIVEQQQIATSVTATGKTTATEPMTKTVALEQAKERWIVMIVKNTFLRQSLIDDISFKKTLQQLENERQEELKRIDDQSMKICPKCEKNYIPNEVRLGSCHYHDGYIVNIDIRQKLTKHEARLKIQSAKLLSASGITSTNAKPPRLIWSCCMGVYGIDPPCVEGICGQTEAFQDAVSNSTEHQQNIVAQNAEKLRKQQKNIDDFIKALNNGNK